MLLFYNKSATPSLNALLSLTDVNQITPGDTLTIYLRNGSVEAQATRVDRRAE